MIPEATGWDEAEPEPDPRASCSCCGSEPDPNGGATCTCSPFRCTLHGWTETCCTVCCRTVWRHPGDEDDEPDDEDLGLA